MKKTLSFLMLLLSIMVAMPMEAQSMLNQTRFTPSNFSNRVENVSFSLRNGGTFEGKKMVYLSNGRETGASYYGTLTLPSGERYVSKEDMSGFDSNLNPDNFVYYFSNDGNVYVQYYQNGTLKSSNILKAKYSFNGPYIVIYTSPSSGGYYDTPAPSGGYTSGGSDYHNPASKSTCPICNGTGMCRQCGGTGNRVVKTFHGNHIDPCGVCHSTGRCTQCHGSGKV